MLSAHHPLPHRQCLSTEININQWISLILNMFCFVLLCFVCFWVSFTAHSFHYFCIHLNRSVSVHLLFFPLQRLTSRTNRDTSDPIRWRLILHCILYYLLLIFAIRYTTICGDEIWCDTLWHNVIWCDVIWCDTVSHDMTWCNMIWHNLVLRDMIWCNVYMLWCVTHLHNGGAEHFTNRWIHEHFVLRQ